MDVYEKGLAEYAEILKPLSLAQFLGVQSWSARQARPMMQTWLHDSGEGTRIRAVHIPTEKTLVDYTKRLYEAVHEIALVYDWSIPELAEQVAMVRADLYFVRIRNDSADGTIPFHQAADVLSSIEKLVRAAANRTNNPFAGGKGRTSERVRDFLHDDLRMGHTKRGSFIITVAARLQLDEAVDADAPLERRIEGARPGLDETVATSPDDVQVDFTRRVMTTLSRSLSVTRRHLAEENDYLGFEDAVGDGMLAPVVEALGELSEVTAGGGLDMEFQWAPTLPQAAQVPTHIGFSPAALERVPSTVRRFERAELEPEVETIAGFVVALEREETDGIDSGEVNILADVGGSLKKVLVELSGTDYEWAIVAHHKHLPFTVTGRLGKKKNRWALLDRVSADTTFLQQWQRNRIERAGGDAPEEIEPPID